MSNEDVSNWKVVPDFLKKLQLDEPQAGGSLVVYHQGKCVVDSSVGYARLDTSWTSDTLSLNFSAGKGVLATLIHCIVSAGLLDYDTPIAEYWTEFGTHDKKNITLREVMSHQANIFAIDTLINDSELITDWNEMVQRIASMSPMPPKPKGDIHYSTAYSALIYGWVLGELVVRVTNQSIQEALDAYLAKPLGIEGQIYFGLPDSKLEKIALPVRLFTKVDTENVTLEQVQKDKIVRPRRKPTLKPDSKKTLQAYSEMPCYSDWQQIYQNTHEQKMAQANKELTTADINRLYFNPSLLSLSNYKSALMPNAKQNFDYYADHVLQAVIPAVNCVATTHALAKIYAMLANGGKFRLVNTDETYEFINTKTFQKLTQIQNTGIDGVMPATAPESMLWRLGYHRAFSVCHDVSHSFGHCGYNGSVAWCDPSRQLAVAFVHNIDTTMLNDIRQFAINEIVLGVL